MTREWELHLLNEIERLMKEVERLREIIDRYGDLNAGLKADEVLSFPPDTL